MFGVNIKKIFELPPPSYWLYIPVPKNVAGLWNSGPGMFVGMKKSHLDADQGPSQKSLPAEERYGVDHPGHERSLQRWR